MTDEDYITTEPGLMPNLLMPLEEQNGVVTTIGGCSTSLWICMDVPEFVILKTESDNNLPYFGRFHSFTSAGRFDKLKELRNEQK